MRIQRDSVDGGWLYPLTQKDVSALAQVVDAEVLGRVRLVRFGCNNRTTQEARLVGRGRQFEIRVNFATDRSGRSQLLSKQDEYIDLLRRFGAEVDLGNNRTVWTKMAAIKYASWLILHELGHIVYAARHSRGVLAGRAASDEERFCNLFAWQGLDRLCPRDHRGRAEQAAACDARKSAARLSAKALRL